MYVIECVNASTENVIWASALPYQSKNEVLVENFLKNMQFQFDYPVQVRAIDIHGEVVFHRNYVPGLTEETASELN